ncbi:19060_t:CDS:2, partial [Dentiscutata erythropus]
FCNILGDYEVDQTNSTQTETGLNVIVPTANTSMFGINNALDFLQIDNIIENYFEPISEANNEFDIEITEHDDDTDTFTYCMDEVERYISTQFRNAKSSDEPVKFAFDIELDSGLLDAVALTNTNISDANFALRNPVVEGSRSSNLQNTSIITHESKMEERKEKYTYYAKKFEKVLELYKREIDNDNFVKNFDTLVGPFVKAVGECEEALQARNQQGTQRLGNKKLAFWL